MTPDAPRRTRAHGLGAGIALLALAALLAWQTTLIPDGGGYAEIGPRAAPWFVTALLAVLGIAIGIAPPARVTGHTTHETSTELRVAPDRGAPDQGEVDRVALAWAGAGLALHLLLIGSAGFVLATAALFACTARAFGSRRLARDAGIGLLLAVTAHLAFARLLGYGLGNGIVERFL